MDFSTPIDDAFPSYKATPHDDDGRARGDHDDDSDYLTQLGTNTLPSAAFVRRSRRSFSRKSLAITSANRLPVPRQDLSPSLTPDNDCDSACSEDDCSEKSCDDQCCDAVPCDGEGCPKVCDDCDDTKLCSRPECANDRCQDVEPDCIHVGCLQTLTAADIAAAEKLASHLPEPESTPFVQHARLYSDLLGSQRAGFGIPEQHAGSYQNIHYHPSMTDHGPFENSHLADGDYLYRPSKRQKGTGHEGFSPSYYDGNIQPGQPSPQSEIDHAALRRCQWGGDCGGELFESAMFDHVWTTHLMPQDKYQCKWGDCEEPTDPGRIASHVKASHTGCEAEGGHQGEHHCLWAGCNARFTDCKDLEVHIQKFHIPNLSCQWDSCGAEVQGLEDLSLHLHTDHIHVPSPPLPNNRHTSEDFNLSNVPGAASRICEWVDITSNGARRACGMSFAGAEKLQQHMKEVHISGLRRKTGYVCQWADCSRQGVQPFSQKGKLERHMQVHTGYKSCHCDVCSKEFSAPQALEQHKRIHTGEKPYKCDTCGKEFAQGSALTMHKRTHTKERPLTCDICGKTFSESSNLSKHKKTHNSVGKHRCTFGNCQKSFHRLEQLKRHSKTHERHHRSASSDTNGPSTFFMFEPENLHS